METPRTKPEEQKVCVRKSNFDRNLRPSWPPVIDGEGAVLAPVVPEGQKVEFPPVRGMKGMDHTDTSGRIVRIVCIRLRRPTASRNASSGPSKRTGYGSITSRPSPS
jgi:hypothetical protein